MLSTSADTEPPESGWGDQRNAGSDVSQTDVLASVDMFTASRLFVSAHLYVSSVIVGIFDVWEPVSRGFGEVLRLGNKPQQLGPSLRFMQTIFDGQKKKINTQR